MIIAFIVSLVPSIALFLWFRGFKEDQSYKDSCKKAFISGIIAVVPVVMMSACFAILKNMLLYGINPLLYEAFHCFVVLALAEELVKYYAGRKTVDKAISTVSWLDVIVFMGIVGIAFGIAEDIPYAIGASEESQPLRWRFI